MQNEGKKYLCICRSLIDTSNQELSLKMCDCHDHLPYAHVYIVSASASVSASQMAALEILEDLMLNLDLKKSGESIWKLQKQT